MAALDFVNDFPRLLSYEKESRTVTVGQYWIKDFYTLIQTIDTDGTYAGWQHLHIYAHQIDFDFNGHAQFGIDLTDRSSLRLFTRTLNLQGNGVFSVLSYEADAAKQAHICVQSFASKNPLHVAVAGTDTKAGALDLPAALTGNALQYTVTLGATPTPAPLMIPPDWQLGNAFYWVLNQTFQEAFTQFSSNLEQAGAMFRWVAFNTDRVRWGNDPNREMQGLGWLAASMAARANRPATLHYVPQLDMQQYRTAVLDAVSAAAPVEQAFNSFIEQSNSFVERKKQAGLFKDYIQGQITNLANQIAASQDRLTKAETDLRSNINLLTAQQFTVQQAQEKLRLAVEQKAMRVFFTALFSLVGSLGTIAMGDPAAAAGAVKAAEGAVETAKAAGQLTDLLSKLKKVVEALKSLGDFALICKKINREVNDINDTDDATDLNTQPTNGADWLTDTEWQVLREQWDGEIRPYTTDDDPKLKAAASDYMTAGRVLVIYGQAATASRSAISQLQQDISQLKVQQKALQTQAQGIDDYMQAEQDDAQQYFQVALLLRQRYLYIKRFLLVQIENFRGAFTYWALSSLANQAHGLTNLGYGSSISEMATVLVSLDQIIQDALGSFPGAPEGVKYQVALPLGLAEQALLAARKPLAIPINPIDTAFHGYDRMRVQYIRVLFPGLAASNSGKTYYVIINDNSVYQDRLNGTYWAFQAEVPMLKGYSAGVNDGQRLLEEESSLATNYVHSAEVSAQTGSDVSTNVFYTPSLFTTWKISLPAGNGDNDTLDLSAVQAVVVQLFGTAIFDQDAKFQSSSLLS
ncbi:hypothetical protein [Hymenobacter cavernae]|uniref:Tc toxin complex TcA C-terminal TcB-binding domain-containing protein n=1 Tax=Hymenobacter cavernae TaxID=2044852 RepID=A0ABQ1TVD7_9BACT|nr:hypothetical protein [Hymenobacter cavernae]GGF04261.1 hypothetical protein GCM10011383_14160 [Hymenobacter cavernae]